MTIAKYIISFIGLVCFFASFMAYKTSRDFLTTANSTKGTVTELIKLIDTTQEGSSYTYAPVISFTTDNGNEHRFRSSTSSNPPSYIVGDTIEILYHPDLPHRARMKSFFSLWGGVLIFGIIGLFFFAVGFSLLIYKFIKRRQASYLKISGVRIETKISDVYLNESISVNGANPFQIRSQWTPPENPSKLYVFKSDNIWFDPSDFLENDEITVLIKKGNPKKYHMDISFLPELA